MSDYLVNPINNRISWRSFFVFFFLLFFVYGLWLLTFFPGALSNDSLGVLWEIEKNGASSSGKTHIWVYFVQLFYKPTLHVEAPIIAQMLICIVFFSRILSWSWYHQFKKTSIFLLLFICLAPQIIFHIGLLYPDAIFSVAITALLFEVWLIAKTKKINTISFCILLISMPLALFTRVNGVLLFLSLFSLFFFISKIDKKKLLVIILINLSIISIATIQRKNGSMSFVFPLVIFETVNFMQPRLMDFKENRVSEKTIETINKYLPISEVFKHYDRDYWDPLHKRNGREGLRIAFWEKNDRKILESEFIQHNLWANLPAFLASRVNVFFVSSFAQGSILRATHSFQILSETQSVSKYRPFELKRLEDIFETIYQKSIDYRIILWNPFLGLSLLFILLHQAFIKRNYIILMIAIPMFLELMSIFFFSIAGEYRYILPFVILPVAFLPIFVYQKSNHEDNNKNNNKNNIVNNIVNNIEHNNANHIGSCSLETKNAPNP